AAPRLRAPGRPGPLHRRGARSRGGGGDRPDGGLGRGTAVPGRGGDMPGMTRLRTLAATTVIVVLAALGLGACADEKPDPAEERRERVESRLRSTFSVAQARCILRQVDGDVVRALDRTTD